MSEYKYREFSFKLSADERGARQVKRELSDFLKSKGYAFNSIMDEVIM